ncbi:TonB-dependent receptor [Paraflavisolibacter sp. H34]|uniref:SusC/RagA family TonB-linked outer membrane protein n=1 Tax=Huijunlia imazamoxiresistens TaxID=3127457 RepID=UPI003019C740
MCQNLVFNKFARTAPLLKAGLLFLLLFLFVVPAALAQLRAISGEVKDSKGAALEGVSVALKNTATLVLSDKSGRFSLNVPEALPQPVLVFSSVGFSKKEVPVTGTAPLLVVLQEDVASLGDVVVIGYGTVRKTDATGSVAKVNMADLQKAPVTSFEQALAGRVAGVQVSSTDGQPGEAFNIVIRGNNSVTGNNSPLYVIDGFPIESPDNNVLNPAEIESINVLKDASATAIYGARGANGVIVITTKRGKAGAPVVTYNGYQGFSKVTRRMELMNPYDFVRLQLEINPSLNTATYLTRGGKSLEDYRNVQGVDFQDQLFRNGPFSNHYLSLSGGNTQTRYTLSGSYTDQKGVVVASGFKRAQGRFTLDQQVRRNFKVGLNANYTYSLADGTQPRNQTSAIGGNDIAFNLLQNVWSYRPVTGRDSLDADLLNELADPDAVPGDPRVNPLFSALNEYNKRKNNTFVANLYAEWDITRNLKFRTTGGANLSRGRNEVFNNTKTRGGSPLTSQGQNNGVNGSVLTPEVNDFVNENTLTYTRRFNRDHELTLLGIYSLQYNRTRATGFSAIKVPNESLGIAGLDEGQIATTTSTESEFGLQSFAARVNYNLFQKYLFTASLRADGSSKFDPNSGNQYGYFPSGAVAWKLGEERFIKNIKAISSAKVRASYGVTGNNRIGPFDYLSQITFYNNRNAYYSFGNALTQAFAIERLGNADLKWESTGQVDMGLELGFLKDRILFEADVYRKRTYDLLLSTPLAPGSGYTTITANVGKTENKGLELTLNTVNVKQRDYSWSTNFNISFNRNKVLALNGSDDRIISIVGGQGNALANVPGYIAKIGRPISQMYGFVYVGNYQLEDFDLLPNGVYQLKDNVPHAGGSANVTRANQKPGDPKYADINGDGLVNDDDITIIGDPNPVHIGGFTNNFTYKNFDLNVFFQWSYGNEVYNANRVHFEGGTPLGATNTANQFASYNDRWTFDNPGNKYYRAFAINSQYANGTRVTSSRVVEDASFLRLKTVQLGYNVDAHLLKRTGIKSLRAYAGAQNLYTWTKYTGMDPEVNTRGTGLTAGYDFSAYPRALTYTFGLNLSF